MRLSRFLLAGVLLLLTISQAFASINVEAIRVWPADAYTRVTLEANQPISYSLLRLQNPDRLVLDLKNVSVNEALRGLTRQIAPDDPYIRKVRIGQYTPDTARLVFDLKTAIRPEVASARPVAGYGWRLMLDIYPKHPAADGEDFIGQFARPDAGRQDDASAVSQDAAGATHNSPTADSSDMAADSSAADGQNDALTTGAMAFANHKAHTHGRRSHHHSTVNAADTQPSVQAEHPFIVAIDPGHGGEDPGATGPDGYHEKNVTLAIGKKLRDLIDATPGMHAVMTRDGDYFIPLHQRVVKARNAHADLFVSIHADASTDPSATGSGVYALSEHGATSAAARYLARQENESDRIGGVDLAATDSRDPYLARTLLDLSQTATIDDSLQFGTDVLDQISALNGLHHGRVEQAGFAVLKAPDIPSILVETNFITNPVDEHRLIDPDYQERMAESIYQGIRQYIKTHPRQQLPRMVVGES